VTSPTISRFCEKVAIEKPVVNGVGALSLCDIPTLLLRRSLGANSEAVRLLSIKPDIQVGITVGAGHFHQLEVPEQVNAMIERFLQLAT
jgi:hypothetical protein